MSFPHHQPNQRELRSQHTRTHILLVSFFSLPINTRILWSDTERRQRQRKKGSKKEEERRRFQWSYEPIGQRLFIRANGTIVDDVTKDLDDDRIRDIENRTFRSFREFRAAHCSSCPSEGCNGGYFLAIAPEVCANQP